MPKELRQKQNSIDWLMFWVIAFLVCWGIFTVSATSFPFSLQEFGHPWYFLKHQILMIFIGAAGAIVLFKIKPDVLRKYAPYLFFANLISLLLVFIPKIGVELQGAHRWVDIGFTLLQPSEFLKITFPLYMAAWLSSRMERSKGKNKEFGFSTLLPFLITTGLLFLILIIQPDLSTLIIISIIGFAMYFLAGTPIIHSLLFGGAGISVLLLAIRLAPYRMARFTTFLNPEADPLGFGYQLKQSVIGIGSGKWFGIASGLAFGMSRQKFGFLPHPTTDSIFAIIGEELGFFGASLLIILFAVFAWRGFRIANKLDNKFEHILVLGIVFWITFQALFNIGGIIGVLPLGGVPLPFFSYGGSHIITEMFAIGILLNLSRKRIT